jgi:hypothetical protein
MEKTVETVRSNRIGIVGLSAPSWVLVEDEKFEGMKVWGFLDRRLRQSVCRKKFESVPRENASLDRYS